MFEFTQGGIEDLEKLIRMHEVMKGFYFWAPPTSACMRRSFERQHTIPEIRWTEGDHSYTAECSTICSCAHIYYKGIFTRDGKSTNIVTIKNSFHRMCEELGGVDPFE